MTKTWLFGEGIFLEYIAGKRNEKIYTRNESGIYIPGIYHQREKLYGDSSLLQIIYPHRPGISNIPGLWRYIPVYTSTDKYMPGRQDCKCCGATSGQVGPASFSQRIGWRWPPWSSRERRWSDIECCTVGRPRDGCVAWSSGILYTWTGSGKIVHTSMYWYVQYILVQDSTRISDLYVLIRTDKYKKQDMKVSHTFSKRSAVNCNSVHIPCMRYDRMMSNFKKCQYVLVRTGIDINHTRTSLRCCFRRSPTPASLHCTLDLFHARNAFPQSSLLHRETTQTGLAEPKTSYTLLPRLPSASQLHLLCRRCPFGNVTPCVCWTCVGFESFDL
jgi:hypothetical protein